jgi:hypothetical protein
MVYTSSLVSSSRNMSPSSLFFQNKFIALAQRLEEVSNFDLNYDDTFTRLRGKTIEYLDLSMVCESIGIKNDDVFFALINEKFNSIIEELCVDIYSDTLPKLIEKKVFDFKSKDGTSLKDRLMTMVKKFYIQFTQEQDMPPIHELYELYWDRLSKRESLPQDPIYLCPYIFLDGHHIDEGCQDEISLDVMLERACMINESHYRLLQWVITMCQ